MTNFMEACENMLNAAKAMEQLGLSMKKAGFGEVPKGVKKDESIEALDPSIKSLIKNGVYGKLPSRYAEDLEETWKSAPNGKVSASEPDTRYNVPKEAPKVAEEKIEETIESTEIYRRAKELILKAQHKQVGYGLDKYPEPLNADTWSILETIDHIVDESIDKLHYLVMLRVKLEQDAKKEIETFREDSLDAHKYSISAMEKLYTEDPVSQKITPIYVDGDQVGYVDIDGKPVWSAKKEPKVCGVGMNVDKDILNYCNADIEAIQELQNFVSKRIREKPFEEMTPNDYKYLKYLDEMSPITDNSKPKYISMNGLRNKLGFNPIPESNKITLGDETIEAFENGYIAVNGREIESFNHVQQALNILTRAVISSAGGNPSVHTDNKTEDK